MTRVLHVTESLAAGGIETTFLNMLRVWRGDTPWATHHVLAFAGGALEQAYRENATSVTIASDQDELEQGLLRGYDVVYILFERCAYRLLPTLIARAATPVVYGKGYDMGGMFRVDAGLSWQADDSLMWGADASTFTTEGLLEAFEAPPGRHVVLGKAADVDPFLSLAPVDASTPMRIVCVANLHARKRLGDLLAAVAMLRPRWPDLRVRFVGADAGREGDRLRELASRLRIAEACELTGRHEDVRADLAASRVFALPSGCEGVPTAMLEAMAAARPVVMTALGHIGSVVREGVDGFLIQPGEVHALAERLERILADPALAARMGAAARDRARAHDVRAVAMRLRSVLEGAATSGGPRTSLAATGAGSMA